MKKNSPANTGAILFKNTPGMGKEGSKMDWTKVSDKARFFQMRTGISVLAIEDLDNVRVKVWGNLPWGALPVLFPDYEKPDYDHIYVVDVEDNWLYIYTEDGETGHVWHFNGYWNEIELDKKLFGILVDWAKQTQKQYGTPEDYKHYGQIWIYEKEI